MAHQEKTIFMQEEQTAVVGGLGKREPGWLQEFREGQRKYVEALPLQKSVYTNLGKLAEKLDWKPAGNGHAVKLQASAGVQVMALEEALRTDAEFVQKCFERVAENAPADRFEAYAKALFTECFFVRVRAGTENADVSIVIDAADNAMVLGFVVVEENASAQVFETLKGNAQCMHYGLELMVRGNARLDFASLEHAGKESTVFMHKNSVLENNARLSLGLAWLGGKEVKATLLHHLRGKGSELQDQQVLYGKQGQLFDIRQVNMHENENTQGMTTLKEVLDGKARQVYQGMIKILKNGAQTQALLQAHGLMLSKEASSTNIPELEIENNNVKATHSASVHHIDEEQLFYLQAKGLGEKEAKQMIILGFLDSVANKMRHPKAAEAFITAIAQKHGET